ncbi:MAG: hypothetical protein HQ565_10140 [Bacteroidetes bacterium]|nr:hypothetical protein [Bacteroidota bacterium]
MKKIIVIILALCLVSTFKLLSQESLLKFGVYKPTYIPRHNNEAMERMFEARYQHALREAEIRRQNDEVQYQHSLRDAEMRRQKAIVKMKQTISFYNAATNYPKTITNGWHRVTSMNNYDFCDDNIVYVTSNKISMFYLGKDSREVIFSSTISNAKAHIRLKHQGEISDILDIYFIENILDPSSKATPPH